MKLNHLNLCVHDLSEAIIFFQKVFEFQLSEQKGSAIAIMDDGHGFTLVLSSMRTQPDENESYPKDFHLGFYVNSIIEVDHFHTKLKDLGMTTDHTPKMIRGGYTLYFTALGGILFEVTCFNN